MLFRNLKGQMELSSIELIKFHAYCTWKTFILRMNEYFMILLQI